MITAIAIADPTTALMLTHLDVDGDGRVRHTRHDLRRRQRRFQRHTRLRKLLA